VAEELVRDTEVGASRTLAEELERDTEAGASRTVAEELARDTEAGASRTVAEELERDTEAGASRTLAEELARDTEVGAPRAVAEELARDAVPGGCRALAEEFALETGNAMPLALSEGEIVDTLDPGWGIVTTVLVLNNPFAGGVVVWTLVMELVRVRDTNEDESLYFEDLVDAEEAMEGVLATFSG
jgi:hypothetical protein